MPIEIRELVIKTTIEENNKKRDFSSVDSINIPLLKEKIIEECIEKVLELMERKAER